MTDEQLIELFEERAAIREFDGKLSRVDAELGAYGELRKLVGRTPSGRAVVLPHAIRRVVSETVNKTFEGKHSGQVNQ